MEERKEQYYEKQESCMNVDMANYNEILMTDVFQSQMSQVSLTDGRYYD